MNTQQTALISKSVINNKYYVDYFYRIEPFHENNSGWIFINGSESVEFLENAENYQELHLHEIILMIPALREYLDFPINSEFHFDEELEKYVDISNDGKDFFVLGSQASRPGKLNASLLLWFYYYPYKLFYPLIFSGLFSYGLYEENPTLHPIVYLLIVIIGYLAILAIDFRLFFEHFKSGCVCPAIVISEKPFLVAVLTDLSKGEGSYPIIRTVKFRNWKKLQLSKGDPVPIVSLYEDSNGPHWKTFKPLPAYYATHNIDELERIISLSAEKEIEELKLELQKLPQPISLISHRIKNDESSW